MNPKHLFFLAKLLEFAGMIIVLVGLGLSISYGLGEDGMSSMKYEMQGLTVGGGLFALGWFLESRLGRG